MTTPVSGWRSGWCRIDATLDNPSHRRCIGEGPSAGKPDGVVKCKCECHDKKAKKRAAAKQAWSGLKTLAFQCPECNKTWTVEDDPNEWAYGHDCEAPEEVNHHG